MSGLDELTIAARRARSERPGVALALATLHAVEGSSYRQPGARLLVDAEGRVLAGAVSGGCLEGDIAAHAADVCAAGIPKRLTYDLRDDLQSIWGFGAMCDGVAHLLLEPLFDHRWLDDASALRAARQHGALVTVLEESAAGGTRLVDDGPPAWRDAMAPMVDAARLTELPVSGAVSIEGAAADVLIDPLVPPVALVLIGAGRGAEAFAGIARTLGWTVTLIDHRPFVLGAVILPDDVTRVAARADDGVAHITRDARTAVALLTHQFAIDAEWLRVLLPLPIGYIGVLGSRLRAKQLMDSLREGGFDVTPRMQHVLHAPIGLDLGGESPESIALAAIAEIEAVIHGRPGGALRERQSPIHTRSPTPNPTP
jgi:xanthine/CO dehydrogenase XdhC/CoxF family maturation factor